MEQVSGWLSFFTKYPDISAAMIGLLLSWFVTQFVKKQLPDSMPDPVFRRVTQIVAFVAGWACAYGAWRLLDPTATRLEYMYYSAGIGFASPSIYSIVTHYLADKYAWVAKMSSGRAS